LELSRYMDNTEESFVILYHNNNNNNNNNNNSLCNTWEEFPLSSTGITPVVTSAFSVPCHMSEWQFCLIPATNQQPDRVPCDQRNWWREGELVSGSQNGGKAPPLYTRASQNPMLCRYPRHIPPEHGEKCGRRETPGLDARYGDRGSRHPVRTTPAKPSHRPAYIRAQVRAGHGYSAR